MWAQEAAAPKPLLLSELSVPGNAGRAYGALTADRNPIHLSSLTSQVRVDKDRLTELRTKLWTRLWAAVEESYMTGG
jgi:hypothetical protein